MPERLFLGVDGGQSSTTALIADESGRIIGRGIGGPCNHASAAEGRRKFLAAVGQCMQQACEQAGLATDAVRFEAVCFGLSGGAEDKSGYIHELIRSNRYKLTHDGEIALTGATGGHPGIIIIAGTGSFAFGKNAKEVTARSGGWGYIFGDEGGAFDLTRKALRASLRYEEGWGKETTLRSLLLAATGAASANELLHTFYGDIPRSKIATYAPLVSEAAENGDPIAETIVEEAVTELCRYVDGVYRQLFKAEEAPQIRYIGGVFQSRLVCSQLKKALQSTISPNVGPPLYAPAFGALLEAFHTAGLSVRLLEGGSDMGMDS